MCMCYEGECNCKVDSHNHIKERKVIAKIKERKAITKKPKKELQSDDFRVNFGKRMISARKMRGLSLEEASKLFFITKQALSRYELGKVEVDNEVLDRFSKAYELPVSFFFRRPMTIEFGVIKVHKLRRY